MKDDTNAFKWGRETRHLPPLRTIMITDVFWVRVRTSVPQKFLHEFLQNWSHPPYPLPVERCKVQPRKGVGVA